MKVPLTVQLIDQILFAMEDQENFSVLNLETRQIQACQSEESLENPALVPLPEWNSIDGFRMMREFSESLRHPALQAELKAILDSGVGVFRRFKSALKPYDTLYRQWTRFKRLFMEARIREWVEDWDQVLDWDSSVSSGAEADQLAAQEFQVRQGTAADADLAASLDTLALAEAGAALFSEAEAGVFAEFWREGQVIVPGDRFWMAFGPGDEAVGLLWARSREFSAPGEFLTEILLWYVKPEFRGLGVGRSLFEPFLADARRRGDRRLVFRPWGRHENLVPLLTRSGFTSTGSFWITQDQKSQDEKPLSG